MSRTNRIRALLLLPAAACIFFVGWFMCLANSKPSHKIRRKAKANNSDVLQFGLVTLEQHTAK